MKIVTAAQMREIDAVTGKNYNIPSRILMENAGIKISEWIVSKFQPLDKRVLFLIGAGNNGGDGLVIARHLFMAGVTKIGVFLFDDYEDLAPDTKSNLDILRALEIDIYPLQNQTDIMEFLSSLVASDLIVDAVYGTGFKGTLADFTRTVFRLLNASFLPVVSVDIPSGVNSDTGATDPDAIKAAYTFTLGLPKLGTILEPAASDRVGELIIENISIPPILLEQPDLTHNLLTADVVKKLLPVRKPVSHKGNYGHNLFIGSSAGMRGAIVLSGGAALRTGAGMVTLALPETLLAAFPGNQPELMFVGLKTDDGGFIDAINVDKVKSLREQVSVTAIGPGLGVHPGALTLIKEVLSWDNQQLLVIDADGLNALEGHTELLRQAKAPVVITPHPGEMSRLTGISVAEIQNNRITIARKYAAEWNAIVVLKGHKTIVAEPGGQIYINVRGNSGMATAGSGDVLTGIIAGLAAQGSTPLSAALTGVFLHASAGDLAAQKMNERSLIASDIIEFLGQAFTVLENQ